MFGLPTVIVMGAGIGFDIEMPLGDRLPDLIANAVDFYIDSGKYVKGGARIASALQQMPQTPGGG